jgi:ribonuclease HI
MINIINIYVDGACAGNGTNHATAGAGIYIKDFLDNKNINICSKVPGKQTNNRAELHAIEIAMQYCNEHLSNLTNPTQINIYSDSTYAIQCIQKNWKRNVNNDLFKDIDDEIDKLKAKNIKIIFQYVKGHSKNLGNDIADALAKHAIKHYFK